MHKVLTEEQANLLRRERSLIEDLRVLLVRLGAPDEDLVLLKRALFQLDELFLLVVVGEFNAGKTAFLNALLGDRLLPEGVLPTTSQIQLLAYGRQFRQEVGGDEIVRVQVPVDWLQEINLVDTPGTNAVIQRHQEITEQFVPRSDLVLFVTSADRPFSESERNFLERIRQWGKKIVIVVNKIDMVSEPEERASIVQYVRDNARSLLGITPEVFTVSARLALQAKLTAKGSTPLQSNELWKISNFEPLEQYVLTSLDAGERLRLKIENPLGVATRVIDQYEAVIADRRDVLLSDFEALDIIEAQMVAYDADMRRDFRYHLSHVDNVLYAMAERGDRFFDDTLRFDRIFDLINGEKLRGAFEREVVADTSREVDRHVSELIDWMVDRDYQEWRAVMDFLNRRSAPHAEQIVGKVGGDFELNRQNLLKSVGRQAQRIVDSYDHESESLKLAQQVQNAMLQTAAVEVSAIGLGAILVAMLHTTILDFTGVLSAGVLAALGFYVLPYRRSKLKTELRERINELRSQLNDVLTGQFERELGDSIQRMHEAISPYTRFVRVEREKLDQVAAEMTAAHTELTLLRERAAGQR